MAPNDRPGCRRHNHVHAAYVNAAIRLVRHVGAHRVEAMLLSEGVPRSVIERVLLVDSPHRTVGLAPTVPHAGHVDWRLPESRSSSL